MTATDTATRTVLVPKGCRLDRVATKAPGRYPFHAVLFVPQGAKPEGLAPCLVATDGHKLAVLPVEHDDDADDGLEPRCELLPREALLEAGKTKGATKEPNSRLVVNGTPGTVTLHRDGRQLTVTDPSLPALDAGDYPDWEAILERLSPTVIKIGLNVAYLADLAAAMRSDRIMLSLDASEPGTKPIRVDPLEASEPPVTADGRKPFGVLMPVTVSS